MTFVLGLQLIDGV